MGDRTEREAFLFRGADVTAGRGVKLREQRGLGWSKVDHERFTIHARNRDAIEAKRGEVPTRAGEAEGFEGERLHAHTRRQRGSRRAACFNAETRVRSACSCAERIQRSTR